MCGILTRRQDELRRQRRLSRRIRHVTCETGFIGYAVLVYQGRLPTSRTEFVAVALVFLVLQVLHDNFARIWLNERAKRLIAAPKPRGEEYDMAPVPPQVPGGLTAEQREAALVEYQAAQDSAQHHDNLVWSVTSLTWVGSVVLIGFVLSTFRKATTPVVKVALLFVAAVGIALAGCVWRWTYQIRRIKIAKYRRCHVLEELLGMEQHRTAPHVPGSQTRSYAFLMILFLLAWLAVCAVVVFGRPLAG
jgi:ABC-type sugar transport system permease subunit